MSNRGRKDSAQLGAARGRSAQKCATVYSPGSLDAMLCVCTSMCPLPVTYDMAGTGDRGAVAGSFVLTGDETRPVYLGRHLMLPAGGRKAESGQNVMPA
jgi:hypothetical protein